MFKKLKVQCESATLSPGIRVLCPTRWTVRANALQSIVNNYLVLLQVWDYSLEYVRDTEMRARIQGVASEMDSLTFWSISCSTHFVSH